MPLFLLRYWKWIAGALVVLAIVTSVALHLRTDTRTRAQLAALTEQAGNVVLATRNASGNDDVTWKTTPGQIVALGESVRNLKSAVQTQNRAIDQLAAEAVAEIKAHRQGVQNVWLKVSAIAGPILTAILTYFQMRGKDTP